MDACSIIGESTDAIVMVDSPVDEKEIREACKRWVVVFSFLFVETSKSLLCNLISSENEWMLKADIKVCVCVFYPLAAASFAEWWVTEPSCFCCRQWEQYTTGFLLLLLLFLCFNITATTYMLLS